MSSRTQSQLFNQSVNQSIQGGSLNNMWQNSATHFTVHKLKFIPLHTTQYV